jgi:predicted PurR-regulated permease PerM
MLLSVVLWGWLWGIGGAFRPCLLTTAVTLLYDAFEPTRPLARFLREAPEQGSRQQPQLTLNAPLRRRCRMFC